MILISNSRILIKGYRKSIVDNIQTKYFVKINLVTGKILRKWFKITTESKSF